MLKSANKSTVARNTTKLFLEKFEALGYGFKTLLCELKKHFPFCAVCEVRFGWGNLTAHLGDETWFRYLDVDPSERDRIIAHRSP